MKHTRLLFGLPVLLALFSLLVLASCSKDDQPAPTNTLAKLIAENSDLSLFNYAMNKSKMNTFTEGPGPFTVLAPNNAAFAAVGLGSEAAIDAVIAADSNVLVNLLTYHVIGSARPQIDIPTGPNAPITTQNGGTLYAAKYSTGVFINGGKVLSPDVMASNGVLHVLDRFLLPASSLNALTYLQNNSMYKLFVQAITRAAVTSSFTATGPITVFAPTNAAFTAAGLDSATIANTPAATLSSIVRYHIYTGRLFSHSFPNGNLKSVQGANILFNPANGTVKGVSNPTAFAYQTGMNSNVIVSNGIVHTIDGVLRP